MTSPISARKGFAPPAIAIFSYAILLAGVITIGFSVYLVVVSYSGLPYVDGWEQIDFISRGGNPLSLRWLWSQHNEHRLFVPRLFFLVDLHWFHARQVFLLASISVIQFLHLLLLSWSMRVLGGWRGAVWRTGVGATAFCLFCPSQWENLTWGFQVCFVLPGLFATLSLIGLLLYWMRSQQEPTQLGSWKYLTLSIAAALGATWSLSNGNLLWPLLVAAALLLRLRLAAVLSFVIAGMLSTALFLYNYAHFSRLALSARTPVELLEYLTAYFGSSWGVRSNFLLAEIFGAAGLTVFFFLLLRLPSYIRSNRPFYVLLVLIALFCFGTGVITAFGRLHFGIGQAFSSRYQTVALLFWCCMGLLLLGTVSSLQQMRNAVFLLSQVVLLAAMLVGGKFAQLSLARARLHGFQLNVAAMALVTNVPDYEQLRLVYDYPAYLFPLVPYMREQQLSVFSEPDSSLLGKPLDSEFSAASPNACTGEMESVAPIAGAGAPVGPPALRITGWAWDYEQRRPPSMIVTTSDGIITGLGVTGDWRPENKVAHPWMTTNYIGFTGYVQDARSSGPVEVYAILRGSPATACLIATAK